MEQNKTSKTGKTHKLVVETQTINYGDAIDKKSIESIAENNGSTKTVDSEAKPFLTKKRIILFFVFFAMSIGFMFVTVFPILKIEWHSYNVSVGLGIANGSGYLWLFLILLNAFININRNFITIMPRINKFGCKISYSDYMLYGITIAFLGAVTPANLICDPYTIFWLRTHGVPTSKSASMFFTNTLIWQVIQIIITTPIYIVCCFGSDKLLSSPDGKLLFSAITIGVIIDFIGLAFSIALNMSKTFHYFCARIFNWLKKKFHMKYHTKEQTIQKYKEKAIMKQEFFNSMKDWKTTTLIAGLFAAGDILGIMAMCWGMYFVQLNAYTISGEIYQVKAGFNFGWVLICARLSVPANRLNILPGQAMGYEAALVKLLTIYSGWNTFVVDNPSMFISAADKVKIEETVVRNAVLTGKVFYSWLPALIGLGGFIALTVQQNRLANQHKLLNKK